MAIKCKLWLREIRSLPLAPASKLEKQILVGNRGNMTPPTTRSELLFPFHPFSGVGGRRAVGSAAIAKLLCSYSGSPVGESNKLLVATFTAALQSYEESLRSRQVSDLSRKSVGVRSLIPPPLLLFHVTQSANMANTPRRHPSLMFPAPKVCLLLR